MLRTLIWLFGICVLVLAIVVVTNAVAPTQTSKDRRAARDELAQLQVTDTGRLLEAGQYGSAGLSGDRPTAFAAIEIVQTPASAMAFVESRLADRGFAPQGSCVPETGCYWERRSGEDRLVRAPAIVYGPGDAWRRGSRHSEPVRPGQRVLEVWITMGG